MGDQHWLPASVLQKAKDHSHKQSKAALLAAVDPSLKEAVQKMHNETYLK